MSWLEQYPTVTWAELIFAVSIGYIYGTALAVFVGEPVYDWFAARRKRRRMEMAFMEIEEAKALRDDDSYERFSGSKGLF